MSALSAKPKTLKKINYIIKWKYWFHSV